MHEVFKKRHSVRSFQNTKVEQEKLDNVLQVIESAPSAGNLKAREVIVAQDNDIKKQLAQAAFGQDFVAEAPFVLVFFAVPSRSAAKYGKRGRDLYALQDATVAASFTWLQIVMLGLSACWVGAFDEGAVNKILNIRSDWRPIALMPMGYSAQ